MRGIIISIVLWRYEVYTMTIEFEKLNKVLLDKKALAQVICDRYSKAGKIKPGNKNSIIISVEQRKAIKAIAHRIIMRAYAMDRRERVVQLINEYMKSNWKKRVNPKICGMFEHIETYVDTNSPDDRVNLELKKDLRTISRIRDRIAYSSESNGMVGTNHLIIELTMLPKTPPLWQYAKHKQSYIKMPNEQPHSTNQQPADIFAYKNDEACKCVIS
jgi:hypothetical protein